MDFFKQLSDTMQDLRISMQIMKAKQGDEITVQVQPGDITRTPLQLVGTAAELDDGFFDAIRKPLEVVAGLKTNAEQFIADATKEIEETEKKEAAKKEAPKNPASKRKVRSKPSLPEDPTPEEEEASPADQRASESEPAKTPEPVTTRKEQEQPQPDQVAEPIAEKQPTMASRELIKTLLEGAQTTSELIEIVVKYDADISQSEWLKRIYDTRYKELSAQAMPAATPAPEAPAPPSAPRPPMPPGVLP